MRNKGLLFIGLAAYFSMVACRPGNGNGNSEPGIKKMPLSVLQDKIKGGWAGQTIGVTFGGPTEFRYNGTFIQDYQVIPWYDGYIKKWMEETPGLFDDIYMDLTFVDVFERVGLDAPVDSFANAFANAGYTLWHANQAARYNILNGIKAPQSGHWLHNPHADDIDYQIESDFAGLMSPGMPNAASHISDKIGHIMNYGDGWYGGVFVGAMYTQAFVSDDIHYVVKEALKTIPKESDFYKCVNDVIGWHAQYPDDWKQTWFELQRKWTEEVGCPDGVFATFDIDAKINAAYIVLGLLYGDGDYTKTLEISTRAGQDSDCNPSSAGGILGTMLGYSNIPAYWKMGLSEVEDIHFKYTKMSLNKVYEIGYQHALEMIRRNGGEVGEEEVTIAVQAPETVRFEKSFDGLHPVGKSTVNRRLESEYVFEFEGTGVVLSGGAYKDQNTLPDYTFDLQLFIDGEMVEQFRMPTNYTHRRHEIFWKYQLPKGKHQARLVVANPKSGYHIRMGDYIVYSDAPVNGVVKHAATN
ncbi:ADP-ribosylglycohydrolase family protein [Parapedobacter sp. 10938]|uniref:ADP-ribosylglycohydrolase family protein n=1 Tax=Parapedobacter flavus TaxID=3110225 RepID=UPI002DB942B5|nr:ADP-ribosylglycohydrolase family protein [Parapedobacter sp. 10938]MEC3880990.1 ADP-ribosylglycohydrolase family protein [Parapedobacter sp. 10938]